MRELQTADERSWVQFLTLSSALTHLFCIAGIPLLILTTTKLIAFLQHGIPRVESIFFMHDLRYISTAILALIHVAITAGMLVGFAVAKTTYANRKFFSPRFLCGGILFISMVVTTSLLLLEGYLFGVIETPTGLLNAGTMCCVFSFMPGAVVAGQVRELLLSPASTTTSGDARKSLSDKHLLSTPHKSQTNHSH